MAKAVGSGPLPLLKIPKTLYLYNGFVSRFKILKKPSWTPPVAAFPIVWTVLYALMGYASYIVWTYGGFEQQGSVLLVYGIQLFLNLLWPILFFKAKKLKLAAAENLGKPNNFRFMTHALRSFMDVRNLASSNFKTSSLRPR